MFTLDLLSLSTLALLPVQQAREPVLIDSTSAAKSRFALSSQGELSVLTWWEEFQDIRVSMSDGRGLEWTVPVAADDAPPGSTASDPRVAVFEDTAYLLWRDDRDDTGGSFSASALFLRTWSAATSSFGPVVRVLDMPDPSLTATSPGALEVLRVGSQVRVHVAFEATLYDPVGDTTTKKFLLATSNDGGLSFPKRMVIAPDESPMTEVDTTSGAALSVHAEGDSVHVFWSSLEDWGGSERLNYQRSSDGGTTRDFPDSVNVGDADSVSSISVDVHGDHWIVVSRESENESGVAEWRVRVSADGGDTFTTKLLNFWPDETGGGGVGAIHPGTGAALVALNLQPEGDAFSRVHVRRTTDGGATWSANQPISAQPGNAPRLVAARDGSGRVLCVWGDIGDSSVDKLVGSVSLDGGATWGATFDVSETEIWLGSQLAAFNDDYQNLVATWQTPLPDRHTYAGGFRPQTLTPTGFVPGFTQIGAEFEAFDDGAPVGWFLLSEAAGDLPLPFGDGRNLGLAAGSLLGVSVDLVLLGAFAAPLAGDGSGALTPIPVTLPSPLTLHAVGLSFDPLGPSFGHVSDVVRIEL